MSTEREKLSKLISENKISEARGRILAILNNDRFQPEFTVQKIIISLGKEAEKLYEQDNQKVSFQDKSQWSLAYWTEMRTKLSNNFSEKKLQHVISVMQYLREQNDPKFTPNKPASSKHIDTEKLLICSGGGNDSKVTPKAKPASSKHIDTKKLLICSGGGAAIGLIIASAVSDSDNIQAKIIGAAIGAIIGAAIGTAIIMTKKD